MEVISLAWQTDLALLAHAGSTVEQQPTYAVVRTPDDPAFPGGNLVLLRRAPLRRDVPRLLELFDRTLPDATHVAFGVDDPHGRVTDLAPLGSAGFSLECSTVLATNAVDAPRHLGTGTEVRALATDADWALRVELHLAVHGRGPGGAYEDLVVRRTGAERRLVEDGRAAWFGAFDQGRMLSGLGIVRAGTGLARYQAVETHPEARRRGLAGSLVHAAGTHALDHLGASRLVIVADPHHAALRLYRALGFRDTERQLQATRSPRITR